METGSLGSSKPEAGATRARGRAVRRNLVDQLARVAVTAGGIGIIASILGILVFLLIEIGPLLEPAQVSAGRELSVDDPAPRALLVDDHRSHAATLGLEGVVRVHELESGRTVLEQTLAPPHPAPALPRGVPEPERPGADSTPLVAVAAQPRDRLLTAATRDGAVVIVPVSWEIYFEGRTRRVRPRLEEAIRLEMDPERRAARVFAARSSEGRTTAAAQLADGALVLVQRRIRENLFTGEKQETLERRALASSADLTHLLLDGDQARLYGAAASGELLWWNLAADSPALQGTRADPAPVTALELLIGDRSLVVGRADGTLSVWFPVRPRRGDPELTRVRDFPSRPAPIQRLASSQRNRTFLAQDSEGGLGLYYSTSGRTLWSGTAPIPGPTAVAFAPKGNAVSLAGASRLVELEVGNPHPETTLASLFGKVWYEGARGPEYVWQSTGGTDEFEPKLSLTPLLVGTLKGTFYSLLLAIPLGVLGALYTSQFMHRRLQRVVKPTVEIMASLPSVVLGFLAGLWLAPRLEGAFVGFMLCLLAFPLLALVAGALFQLLPRRARSHLPDGTEVFWFAGVLALGFVGCFALGETVERTVFDGSFTSWLLDSTGARYDQRNAVVIGIAMGFAVIPIIFAIAEDAFSNVPRSLAAASRALGANRWQTAVRVILPTASPGIFSAIMVGFGRAVGETMIVLMATGNTPILDWSAFNGFRTLSANIAVEIPEAPVGGTLYRTLFVAALLLFVLTFLVNTAAEVVRHRLRRRFARL